MIQDKKVQNINTREKDIFFLFVWAFQNPHLLFIFLLFFSSVEEEAKIEVRRNGRGWGHRLGPPARKSKT